MERLRLEAIARRIGGDHFLIGNVDTAVLTFGTSEDVVREVRRCLEEARACAGHFIKATGDLPHSIPRWPTSVRTSSPQPSSASDNDRLKVRVENIRDERIH